MIAIVDYGVGNLFSLASSLAALGIAAEITDAEARLAAADRIILPGVGAFGDAAAKLRAKKLDGAVQRQAARGKPLLGICLGMQLLFDESFEFGRHAGLGLVPGQILPLADALQKAGYSHKVPHIGWNNLHIVRSDCPLLQNTCEGDSVYYVHSFYAAHCEESIAATSEYGVQVPGVVWRGNVYGTQFHPEKSGEVGLRMLKAFGEVA